MMAGWIASMILMNRSSFAQTFLVDRMHSAVTTTGEKKTIRHRFLPKKRKILQITQEVPCIYCRCVKQSVVCDDKDDCGDNSDELTCSNQNRCSSSQFQCERDQFCIEGHFRCDGKPFCSILR